MACIVGGSYFILNRFENNLDKRKKLDFDECNAGHMGF